MLIEPLMIFTGDINPVPWKAPTLGTKRYGGRTVPTASPSAEMGAYQEAIREAWEPLWDREPITGPVRLMWEFRRQLVQYRANGGTGRLVTKKACDLSNVVKASEDAIQPWLIKNDVQVMSFSADWLEPQSVDAHPQVKLTLFSLEKS